MSESQTDSSDDELLAKIAAGDAAAFTVLFRRRQRQVYRFALHMSGTPAIAEDVTQDVFLVVMRDARGYVAGRSSVTAWLCGIARNHVLRRLERDRATVSLREAHGDDDLGLPTVHPDPIGDLTRAERLDALRTAVLSLPIRYREAVVLCDLQELSYADAAEALECAIGTVRSRLHRGRALLVSKMKAGDARQADRASGARLQPDPSRPAGCIV